MHTHTNPLSSAQLELLRWAAGLGVVTAEAFATHALVTPASARARLGAAERAGLLERRRPLADAPSLYTLTRTGVRMSALRGVEPGRLSAGSAVHAATCAAVAAELERAYSEERLMGECELRRREHEAGRPLASAVVGCGAGHERRLHRPDLVLWPQGPTERLPVTIEVELTLKAPRRLLSICRAWARCREIAGCIYLADDCVQRGLERAIGAAQAGEQIAVVPLATLIGRGAYGTRCSRIPSQGRA